LARALSHHGSIAHAYWLNCEVLYLRRDASALCNLTSEVLPFLVEHGSVLAIANARVFRGWGLIAAGSVEQGTDFLREGLSFWRRTGSKFQGPYRLARVADGLLRAGKTEEALELLAEAAALARETGEHWSDAELDRLSGIARLRQASPLFDPERAGQCLRRAVNDAHQREIRLTELQAATSLARLWRDQGRSADAHDLLAPIYIWFTEGFDTPDLIEARALLDELGATHGRSSAAATLGRSRR
jgi:predicted ATPase